ncbi:thiamine phosphate synthase [Desulfovibrio inopinatus]|uniref:thiamine phosphate synthase n=1 Tax=Desulfovibrio inopinatus TaxID=102109 RepID=UPI00041CC8E5|nr:thiamine phosphate synthase [Desulfovibrio inopinatus]
MKPTPDYSVYLVTDRPCCLGRDVLDVVRQAVAGGAGVVQLREKSCDTRTFVELARAIKSVCSKAGALFVINDRLDVALAVDADGVHVGQDDMPVSVVREWIGPSKIVGLSVNTIEQAIEATGLGVDYLGVGPVFPTVTKADAKTPLGPEGLADMRTRVDLPLVGIGGITVANAAEVIRAGAVGVAVVSAICSASSPAQASAQLRDAVDLGPPN